MCRGAEVARTGTIVLMVAIFFDRHEKSAAG
jgi:hypothetical protein